MRKPLALLYWQVYCTSYRLTANLLDLQVYAVDWSQTRGENLVVSGSWDHTAKVVSVVCLGVKFKIM